MRTLFESMYFLITLQPHHCWYNRIAGALSLSLRGTRWGAPIRGTYP